MKIKNRNEIEEKYKWRLEDIVPSDEDWEVMFKQTEKLGKELGKFDGKLDKAENILECLRFDDEVNGKLERLYVYAKCVKTRTVQEKNIWLWWRESTIFWWICPKNQPIFNRNLQPTAKNFYPIWLRGRSFRTILIH